MPITRLPPAILFLGYVNLVTALSQKVIPITVLSGFLGSGKTTLLQHLLNNNEGLKIAVIVNDVAQVNIDNKLIVGNTAAPSRVGSKGMNNKPAGIVELSNGCACCSLSDELLPSVSELVTLSDLRSQSSDGKDDFDHIVIEMSGVGSPKAIRSNFQEAEYYGMPLLERVRLDTMVTVVDCSNYLDHLRDKEGRLVNEEESPDLFYTTEQQEADDRWAWLEQKDTPETATVSQLLVEQTEVSDIILLNKIDTLEEDESGKVETSHGSTVSKLSQIGDVVSALNSRAKIFKTKFGVVDKLGDILGASNGLGVADSGVTDDHRDAIQALQASGLEGPNVGAVEDAEAHGADLNQAHSHSHSHSHSHEEGHDQINTDLTCTDSSLSHEEEHDDHANKCTDPDCSDPGHSHSHSHADESTVCTDPDCSDTGHSHTHSHEHSMPSGIGSFVYRARRPFHPHRLLSILQIMPVVRGLPTEGNGNCDVNEMENDVNRKHVFGRIMRSKGFSWLANSHIAAMYWSHAGSSFEMQCLGRWWATLPQDQWPEEAVSDILVDFDDATHKELSSLSNGLRSVGDRRQEIVLIGPGMGSAESQNVLQTALDKCLLTDDEFEKYKKAAEQKDEAALQATFASSIPVQMLTY